MIEIGELQGQKLRVRTQTNKKKVTRGDESFYEILISVCYSFYLSSLTIQGYMVPHYLINFVVYKNVKNI